MAWHAFELGEQERTSRGQAADKINEVYLVNSRKHTHGLSVKSTNVGVLIDRNIDLVKDDLVRNQRTWYLLCSLFQGKNCRYLHASSQHTQFGNNNSLRA
jgi:hypothetical protein